MHAFTMDIIVRILDRFFCNKEPNDYLPYEWRYHELAMKRLMKRIWYLYNLYTPLRVRIKANSSTLVKEALDISRLLEWYDIDPEFRGLVNFVVDRLATTKAMTSVEMIQKVTQEIKSAST